MNPAAELERRAIGQERAGARVETRNEGEVHVVGYAAVYYRESDEGTQFRLWDDYFERIMPGAFDDAIRDDDVRGLFNHDSSLVLGRNTAGTMELSADSVGLRYDITLPTTQVASDLAESINRGDVTGSSFGFVATDVTWRDVDDVTIREINKVNLFDVGPVTFPAYSATSTDVAKRSLDSWKTARKKSRREARRRARRMRLAALNGATSSTGSSTES